MWKIKQGDQTARMSETHEDRQERKETQVKQKQDFKKKKNTADFSQSFLTTE